MIEHVDVKQGEDVSKYPISDNNIDHDHIDHYYEDNIDGHIEGCIGDHIKNNGVDIIEGTLKVIFCPFQVLS